jgi:hypothetical protein
MGPYITLSDAFMKFGVAMPPEFLEKVIKSANLTLIQTLSFPTASPLAHLEQHQKLSMQGWVE